VNEQQPGDLAAVFERLQSLLLTASEVEGFLQRLTELGRGGGRSPADESCATWPPI
jgi:hypothetical protein